MPETRSARTATLAALLVAVLPLAASAATPRQLWEAWPESRFVETPAPCLRPAALQDRLAELAAKHPGRLRVEELGRSVQGRPISLMTLGSGDREVLLWSQMHGNEPSATPALLDLADWLLTSDDPGAAAILDELTLLMVPMLNPDGAEVYDRRNAQAIDMNRDALNLSTPEGRLLKALRDEREPILGFNLHDQDRRRTVGDTRVLAANAVLAVVGDEAGTVTPGRERAMRAAVAVADALEPFAPGAMARYDDSFSPRAFGDNVTAWGTPVLLIESGGLPPGRPFEELTRLNFVGILSALEALARDDLGAYDAARYAAIPENELGDWVDVAVRGGEILQAAAGTPYRADLAFDVERSDRAWAGCPDGRPAWSRIEEVGDARFLAAGRTVEAEGRLVTLPFLAGIDGWRAHRWLDAAALDTLARVGVGSVRWAVPERRLVAARKLAESLRGEGRPRVEVVPAGGSAPWLEISRRPAAPAGASVAAAVAAIAGPERARELAGLDDAEAIARLTDERAREGRPGLRPGGNASFLLLAPGGDGLGDARVEALWIDGVEAGAGR